MEIALGFLIAVAIGITGVGAGIITAPVLILFFHVTPAYAVGTALAFGVAVKLLVVPMQLFRKQVDFRVLGYMLAGGLPGVLIGSAILSKLNVPSRQGILYAALGSTIEVPTLKGTEELNVPSGSQHGEVFKMKGKGLPDLRSYKNGDELVQIVIEIPKKLTEKQKTLLREFAETEDDKVMPQRKGFLDKIKSAFKGDA